MGKPIEVTRLDYTAMELRALASHERDGAVVRRLLAIAAVLDGDSRTEAAEHNGMDRQTLRDWVHRYNAEGVDGLYSRESPGRPPALSAEQMEELRKGRFVVPSYQRGYRWSEQEVGQLVDDIQSNVGRGYCLQPIVVERIDGASRNVDEWTLVDGQQRLTTLFLLVRLLGSKPSWTLANR